MFNMKLSSIVKALSSLCLLLKEGFPASASGSPEIVGPGRVQIKVHPGELLILHCDAVTNADSGVTLIYWLINGAFPDEMPSSSRIIESQESALEEGVILQRSLVLKNVTSEDFKSTMTCVVTNASGMARKHVKLSAIRIKAIKRTKQCKNYAIQ